MEEKSSIPQLKQVFDHISTSLTDIDKQKLSNMCNSIKNNFKGDNRWNISRYSYEYIFTK